MENEESTCHACGKTPPVFQYSIKIQRRNKLVKELCICEDCIDASPHNWITVLCLKINRYIHPYK